MSTGLLGQEAGQDCSIFAHKLWVQAASSLFVSSAEHWLGRTQGVAEA